MILEFWSSVSYFKRAGRCANVKNSERLYSHELEFHGFWHFTETPINIILSNKNHNNNNNEHTLKEQQASEVSHVWQPDKHNNRNICTTSLPTCVYLGNNYD